MAKYHNKKCKLDGVVFDSIKEARRYQELKFLEKAGEIRNLQTQVKFVLIPSQRIDGKVVERECSYKADFVYEVPITIEKLYSTNTGKVEKMTVQGGFETVVEDTKGMRTTDYIIKRKLMLYVHGIRIKEV